MKERARPGELEIERVEGLHYFLSLANTILTVRCPPENSVIWDIPVECVKITHTKAYRRLSSLKSDAMCLDVDGALFNDPLDNVEVTGLIFWVPREPGQREQLETFLRRVEDAKEKAKDCHDKAVMEFEGERTGCLDAVFTFVGLNVILFLLLSFVGVGLGKLTHDTFLFIWLAFLLVVAFPAGWIYMLCRRFSKPRLVRKINRCFDENKLDETLALLAEFESQNALDKWLASNKVCALRRLRRFDEAFAALEKHRPLFKPKEWQSLCDETRAVKRIQERKMALD